jgi:hypothetical protein
MSDIPRTMVFGDDAAYPDWRDWEVVNNETGKVIVVNGIDTDTGSIHVHDPLSGNMMEVEGDYSLRKKAG